MQNSSRLLADLCLALILLAATRIVAETSSRRALVIEMRQVELAKALGITQAQLSKYERGQNAPLLSSC
jgi:DNA-binding transcriptional regulator YiaG